MNKRMIRIGVAVAIIFTLVCLKQELLSLFRSPTASAIGDLSVDWGVDEGNPIFTITNMAPGDDESRTVIVHNDAITLRSVSVRATKNAEIGLLSNAYSFKISQDGIDLYGGSSPTGPKTLSQFLTESSAVNGVPLSILQSNTSTSYTFIVTFLPESENIFQNSQISFDLQIGLTIETPPECDSIRFLGNPIYGSLQNDILRGTSENDLIFSLESNDTIYAGGGDDCIISGTGNDIIFAGDGNDIIIGGSGNDSQFGGFGNDILIGDAGRDIASGESGTDTCISEVRLSCER